MSNNVTTKNKTPLEIISRQAAYQMGKRRFYTGTPCRSGHLTERYVSNGVCIGCINGAFKFRQSGISHDLMPFVSNRLWVTRDFTAEETLALDRYLQVCIIEFTKHAGKITPALDEAYLMHLERLK